MVGPILVLIAPSPFVIFFKFWNFWNFEFENVHLFLLLYFGWSVGKPKYTSHEVYSLCLCMIVLIVTRKRGDGRYYFALWQTNNNTPNKLLLSEFAVSCLLRVRSVSFTSRAKGCIKFVPHSCLVCPFHIKSALILIRLYFMLTILITEDDHNHIVFNWIKIIAYNNV
jgi:hypothetical protein